jgi:hypothetical protein
VPWLLVVALLALARTASAQAPPSSTPRRQATFVWDQTALRVSVSYRDVVDDAIRTKLKNGLPTTILLRGELYRESGGAAVARTAKTCKVTYDLWDEIYRLEIAQLGAPDAASASPTLEGVLRKCAEADRLLLADRSALDPAQDYYFAATVEVNPVSQEMVEKIRRWVSRPASGSTSAPGDALFGSFVGLFVARIGQADRLLVFRTQPFRP